MGITITSIILRKSILTEIINKMDIRIIIADYSNTEHGQDIIYLLNDYANDAMGGGEPLSAFTTSNLISCLANIPNAFSILCYIDSKPVGLANCFEGFSTFQCKPLIYIHDIVVIKKFRGQGIAQALLQKIEDIAVKRLCCKITLEVLDGNESGISAYKKFGFSPYELQPEYGHALFWEKKIVNEGK